MSFSPEVIEILSTASAKALATDGPHGINVVPVSMIKINDDSVWLFDFFMKKTVENIIAHPEVALTAWSNMVGIQLKATVRYCIQGEEFAEAVSWVREQNPTRVVKGLIVLTPTSLFDISPGGFFSDKALLL